LRVPPGATISAQRSKDDGGVPLRVSGRPEAARDALDTLSMRLRGGPEAAASARRALARLRGELDEPVVENMRLLVTELVGNSVRHARANNVGLKVLVTEPSVWIEVTDEGPGFEPEDRPETQDDLSGWGLFLVDRLADRWGVARHAGHTRVWFELKRA
jgi:anti-sigma regulatory factor (Ser/Thr protein kinase)